MEESGKECIQREKEPRRRNIESRDRKRGPECEKPRERERENLVREN